MEEFRLSTKYSVSSNLALYLPYPIKHNRYVIFEDGTILSVKRKQKLKPRISRKNNSDRVYYNYSMPIEFVDKNNQIRNKQKNYVCLRLSYYIWGKYYGLHNYTSIEQIPNIRPKDNNPENFHYLNAEELINSDNDNVNPENYEIRELRNLLVKCVPYITNNTNLLRQIKHILSNNIK